MSYGLKYTSTAPSKSDDIYQINVYERDYVGAVIEWELGSPGLQRSYLASSDDVLEPFLASTLTVNLVQGEEYNLPDVTTFDDRKYYGELKKNSVVIFKGFLLNDSISLPFTTGHQYINLTFTDGIGILKDVELIMPIDNFTNSLNTSKLISLLDVVLICIKSLEYDVNINIATSIFAQGMDDRGDGTQYEPLSQAYLPIRDFLKTDETFISCYEALEMILKSFGAQLLQDNGEFWFVSQYERDSPNLYFTKYNQDGTLISSGLRSNSVTVGTYPTEPYFVNGDQNKILKKGFNKIVLQNPNEYAVEMLANPNLIIGDPLSTDYWTIDSPFFTNYVVTGPANFPFFRSDITSAVGGSFTGVSSNTQFNVNIYDTITFAFNLRAYGTTTNKPDAFVQIRISDGTDLYYWSTLSSGENGWIKNAGGTDVYYKVPAQSTLNGTSVSITTTGCPVNGVVFLAVYFIKNETNDLADYGQFSCTLVTPAAPYNSISALGSVGTLSGANFILASPYTFDLGRKAKLIISDFPIDNAIYVDIVSQSGLNLTFASAPKTPYTVFIITQDFQYETSTEIKIGTEGIPYSIKGVLLDSTGAPLIGWYRYGNINVFASLFDLVNKLYANQYAYNQINVDGTIYSIRDSVSSFTFFDATDGYNINEKRYVIGNMNIDYIENEMSGTFLEVNNDDIQLVRYNVYNKK